MWVASPTAYDGFVVLYEPSRTQGGILNISASRYPANGVNQTVKLFAGPIFQNRTFRFTLPASNAEGSVSYYDETKSDQCNSILSYYASYLTGQLTLTRLDEQAGIISGTFDFTIAKPGCDTIRVTDGRFDKKL
ncbi:hypothetical protein Q5H93_06065 [Hymenobacter sp. ASUV-10]|uniref:Uncharacterized protein n=1 Tax=Hymenobacter aranciens TaxID=3063996 RepID=A0ABT9B7N6_9BACT|nr:hypothetical protein [Hymenobacter sp. ASUV-10]MDO7874291.1 hypothetical protein [Hymenobacter sp. ASUV-10]